MTQSVTVSTSIRSSVRTIITFLSLRIAIAVRKPSDLKAGIAVLAVFGATADRSNGEATLPPGREPVHWTLVQWVGRHHAGALAARRRESQTVHATPRCHGAPSAGHPASPTPRGPRHRSQVPPGRALQAPG